MRKLIGFISVAIAIMVAASCGSGNTPGAIVEKAMNDMINGNYDAFIEACDLGEDSLPADQVNMAKQTMKSLLEKTMKGVKEGKDEEAKKKLPKSCKVLSEDVKENEAVVELEITTEGGDTSSSKITLKKNKKGDWKIADGNSMMPAAPAMNLGGEEEEAGEAVEDAAEDAAEAAEAAADAAEDAADAAADAADAVADAAEAATE